MRTAHRVDAARSVPVTAGPALAERAVVFDCRGERLLAILSLPPAPHVRGVLIVVGGPQYRVGSHRQFALLARALAAQGIPCMRFDCRGMGDSTGAARSFEQAEDDLHSAIDAFVAHAPGLQEVVLWGLCDAASAALMFGVQHARVRGAVLLNPWVRSEATLSQARIKHYYKDRLLSADLWRKLVRGGIDWRASAASLLRTLRSARTGRRSRPGNHKAATRPFQQRMAEGLLESSGPVLLVISGGDLTAREFLEHAAHDPQWRRALARPGVSRVDLPQADHTFSQRAWRMQVEQATLAWLRSW
jgi:exosortase A-associated hydrolase 1